MVRIVPTGLFNGAETDELRGKLARFLGDAVTIDFELVDHIQPEPERQNPQRGIAGETMIRADLHCHTCYSHDSFAAVDAVLEQASRRGLTHLAITDHDEIEGALRARDKNHGLAVIVGTEVSLEGGAHIIGLFLERKIKARKWREAVDEIRAQHGFVVLPHPFHPTSGLLCGGIDEELLRNVDAIEVCNGYEPADRNESAARLARERGLPEQAGSDAHYAVDVGRACVEFPEHLR